VVHDAAGGVLSRASNKVEAFNLAGVLRIGGVTSEAEVNATLGAPRKLRSNLAVSDVTVAGQTVGVTDKGLVVAGTTVPLPADDRLAQVLRDQDVTVAYVKSERTADAITSAGLRVTTRRAVPGLPEPVQMSYLFGRAHASATAGRDTGDSTAVAPAPPLQPPASGARTGASAPLGSSRRPTRRRAAGGGRRNHAVLAGTAPDGRAPRRRCLVPRAHPGRSGDDRVRLLASALRG
jgi:hypothetical protein